MSKPKDIPVEWLQGSPFSDYIFPGLFLGIGGVALIASILEFKQYRLVRKIAFICGVIILLWIGIQVSIIGSVSRMQPTTALTDVLILFLALKLPKYE